jgi:hypothetical protein
MAETTDAMTPASVSAIETAPLEHGIAAALESMRWAAAEAAARGRDDFYDAWQADAMDRQPMIFVAVALPGQTTAWLLDPSPNEGVLEVDISHHFELPDAEGQLRGERPPVATREIWTRLFDAVAEDISWLVRERSGSSLRDYWRWRPETDE